MIRLTRVHRSFLFKAISFLIFTLGLLWLVISLKELILPVIVGGLLAYLLKPLLNLFKYHWLPDSIRIFCLVSVFVGFLFSITWLVRTSFPDDIKKLELLTRIQYKMNERVDEYLQVHKPKEDKTFIANLLSDELSPFIYDINQYLSLNQSQQKSFLEYYQRKMIDEKYYQYFLKNIAHDENEEKREVTSVSVVDDSHKSFTLSRIMDVFSIWIVMPLVFIFLLFDKGEIYRYFVNLIPNRYFELTLTVFEQVDIAIGRYLRGTLLQCSLVALAMFVGLFLIGMDFQAAFLIGAITGLTNAIPFLGPFVGCVVGVAYAMIAEGAQPLIPFMTADDLMIGVVACVVVTHLLDNIIFQPIIVGSAVNLHPIVVVIGVIGGSMLFGFAGILLAIPAIVVLKVSVETLYNGLKEYYII